MHTGASSDSDSLWFCGARLKSVCVCVCVHAGSSGVLLFMAWYTLREQVSTGAQKTYSILNYVDMMPSTVENPISSDN